jgi:hypothetical protein
MTCMLRRVEMARIGLAGKWRRWRWQGQRRRYGSIQYIYHCLTPSVYTVHGIMTVVTPRISCYAGKLINVYITINYNYVSAHDGHVYLRKSLYRVHYPEFLPWTRTDFDPLIL